jgi:hypothetical protein
LKKKEKGIPADALFLFIPALFNNSMKIQNTSDNKGLWKDRCPIQL